jgi:hypothetical protein
MPQVYVIERGTRYQNIQIVETHNTQVGGENAAALMVSPTSVRQDPPANGYLATWMDSNFDFYGVRLQEVLAP